MVSGLQITHAGGTRWRLTWETDLPGVVTFYVYRDGEAIGTTTAREYPVTIAAGEAPVFDVLDVSTPPARRWPRRVILSWYGTSAAEGYDVEEYDGASWRVVERVREDRRGYYTWESGVIADGATAQFRVTPVGADQVSGTQSTITVPMVRIPDPPAAGFAYSASTKRVTVSV